MPFGRPSSLRTNLHQNQWRSQTKDISSMGTFFVSGRKKKMKTVIIVTHTAKKKNKKYLRWHNMSRKIWAMIKVKNMLTDTFMLCPADRISRGEISLGTSHPNGPQDHANAET